MFSVFFHCWYGCRSSKRNFIGSHRFSLGICNFCFCGSFIRKFINQKCFVSLLFLIINILLYVIFSKSHARCCCIHMCELFPGAEAMQINRSWNPLKRTHCTPYSIPARRLRSNIFLLYLYDLTDFPCVTEMITARAGK